MGEPLVSVITIFLNEEKYIDEAVKSILAQSYANWELLLVDDGSSDRSTEIAKGYAKDHPMNIRYLEHEGHVNKGKSTSRNLGIAHARGEFIAFLDADDACLPNRFEKQVDILTKNPDVGMVVSPTIFWFEGQKNDYQRTDLSPGRYPPPTWLKRTYDLKGDNSPANCSILMRKELISKLGGFEEWWKGPYEDEVLMIKAGLETTVYYEPDYVSLYRRHSSPATWFRYYTASPKERLSAVVFLFSWASDYVRRHRYQGSEELLSSMWEKHFPYHIMDFLVSEGQLESALAVSFLHEFKMPGLSDDITWNYYSAYCMHMLGINLPEALRRYDAALELGYDEFLVRFNRGSLHTKMGNIDKARGDLTRALELRPDHNEARQLLQQLPVH